MDSELAAIYWTMLHRPDEHVSHVSQEDIRLAKRVIYDLARHGKIKNHGGPNHGQGRWDLVELWQVYNARKSG